jgi:4-hydroxy-tetrahydrodipicolinate synthase
MLPATVARLARIPNIVGIKEATGNLDRAREILKLCPKDFELYSGDDATGMECMLLGGKGVISVTTNVAPRAMQDMCAAASAGDEKGARAINDKLMGLHQKLFVEANPIPVKWVLEQMGLIEGGIRLPLTRLSDTHHETLRQAMRAAGLK